MKIHFEKLSEKHLKIILTWLSEPHVMEFWDNSQAHKDDIIYFVHGRQQASPYADGKYVYWISFIENEPFAMIMTIQETLEDDINQEKLKQLSKTGNSYSLDFMIGNTQYLNKGYGSTTLTEFIKYFRKNFDQKADTFFIDPAADNEKASHVYLKAGFQHVCDFMMEGNVSVAGKIHQLLIKKFNPSILIRKTAASDIPQHQSQLRERSAYGHYRR